MTIWGVNFGKKIHANSQKFREFSIKNGVEFIKFKNKR